MLRNAHEMHVICVHQTRNTDAERWWRSGAGLDGGEMRQGRSHCADFARFDGRITGRVCEMLGAFGAESRTANVRVQQSRFGWLAVEGKGRVQLLRSFSIVWACLTYHSTATNCMYRRVACTVPPTTTIWWRS